MPETEKRPEKLPGPARWLLLILLVFAALVPSGCRQAPITSLSFKPFTPAELLSHEIRIDPETTGTPVESERYQELMEVTSGIRGLDFLQPVRFVALSREALGLYLLDVMSSEVEDADIEADERMLAALGLLPEGGDLKKTMLGVLTEQIAGSYDTSSKLITLVEGGPGETMDDITIVHELVHALQDQHFNLEEPPLEDDAHNSDTRLAILSLIEGDAMYTMEQYIADHVDLEELLLEVMETSYSMNLLKEAPVYIQKSLLFPYQEGERFARALVKQRGFEELDAAFRDPPLSTIQVMYPARYLDRREPPRTVTLPDLSQEGQGWTLRKSDIMGAFDVNTWFEVFSGLLVSREVSRAWAGNCIDLYLDENGEQMLVNLFAWDSQESARAFLGDYRELLENRFEDEVEAGGSTPDSFLVTADGELFYCGRVDDLTLCLQAPDTASLEHALEKLGDFPRVPR